MLRNFFEEGKEGEEGFPVLVWHEKHHQLQRLETELWGDVCEGEVCVRREGVWWVCVVSVCIWGVDKSIHDSYKSYWQCRTHTDTAGQN